MTMQPKHPALLTSLDTGGLIHLLRGCVEALRQRGAAPTALAVLAEEQEELALALGSTPTRASGRPTLTVIQGDAA